MKWRMHAAYVAVLVVVISGLAPLMAVSTSKFAAWTWHSWSDSLIPLHFSERDPRNDRQNTGSDPNLTGITLFATAYKGHLYVVDDEPDIFCITPWTYAERYHDVVTAVLAVDPTARFSPAGFADHKVPACSPDLHGTAYADAFLAAYVTRYGVAPRVDEWRFHFFINPNDMPAFIAWVSNTANWAVTNGAPLYIGSTGFPDTPPTVDVRPQMRQALDVINADSRIVGAAFWNYDIFNPSCDPTKEAFHTMVQLCNLSTPQRVLSADGLQLAAYTTNLVSAQRSGLVEVGDFNGDGFADFADHQISGRRFWVHRNLQNGSFDTANWAIGDLIPGYTPTYPGDWDVLVGDFTGDGLADYADVHVPSNQAWIHRNLGNGSFDPGAWAWGQGRSGADWELLAGDFDGDGRTDLIEHQLSSGLLWVLTNLGNGTFSNTQGWSVGRSAVGPGWKTVIADFTGDGKADYADLHVPSNKFWVHPNVAWTTINNPGLTRVFNSGHIAVANIVASAGWETVIGDFTGDGRADYADRALGSGTFYIHQNLGNGTFAVTDWGVGQSVAGADWNILGSR